MKWTSSSGSSTDSHTVSIAFDASYTHMYAPGTRRHIRNGPKAGATMEEVMEVLKLCVVQGVQACNLGVPILAAELVRLYAGGECHGARPVGEGAVKPAASGRRASS